jgi:hypothetical protein
VFSQGASALLNCCEPAGLQRGTYLLLTVLTFCATEFTEKCYLGRLIDKRWQGMAVGVGASRIVGRIHQAPLKIGGGGTRDDHSAAATGMQV